MLLLHTKLQYFFSQNFIHQVHAVYGRCFCCLAKIKNRKVDKKINYSTKTTLHTTMYCAMYVMRLLNSRSVIDVSIWFCVMVAVLNHAMFTYLFLRREYLLPGSTSPERPIMIVRISISHSHLFNKLENHIAFI